MNKKLIVSISMLSSALILTACSPAQLPNENSYLLKSVPTYIAARKASAGTMYVVQPDTSIVYNTTQMAYTQKPYQIAYFSQNRWAEPPGQMLQPLIVQALQNTHAYRAVVSPPFVGSYDYALSTHILELTQDYTYCQAQFRLTVRAELGRTATNEIIATRQFKIIEPIMLKTPYGGVIAANRATAKLMRELAEFAVNHSI